MKTRLLLGYFLVIATYFLPLNLNKPHEAGILKEKIVMAAAIKPVKTAQFEKLSVVPISSQDYVRQVASKYGWDSGAEWNALNQLITNESGWHPYVYNSSSSACGLFQALPCSKIGAPLTDVHAQAKFGITYIKNRYGTPSNALSQWYARSPHWY